MRERPEQPVDVAAVLDSSRWLAHIGRLRDELEAMRREFGPGAGSGGSAGAGAGAGPAADDAYRRGLLCELLARSLGQAAEYPARPSLDTDDPEHRQADDPGLAACTPARSVIRPSDVGPAAPFPSFAPFPIDDEDAELPWRHLRRLFVEPDPSALLPVQRGTAAPREAAPGSGAVAGAEWHLDRDDVRWSAQMYTLFDRDRALGPLPLAGLAEHVAAEDREFVADLVHELLVRANGVEGEFRIVRRDGTLGSVQFVGEPVLGADGVPHAVWALLCDITELRRTQQVLSETRAQLLAQRRLLRSEHRIAAELQRVVMPWWTRPIELPGIEVAARYFPAELDSKVGGDWYDALALPDGEVLLAVGDMSGHGIAAASGMTTLRGALRGVALTGAGPAAMLAALNRIVVHTLSADKVATAVCARFTPGTRQLCWAQGGHPPPLLYRAGVGRALTAPFGVLLGALDEPEFVEARVELRPGDVLLIFTDGLVERRGRGTEEAVRALLGLGPLILGASARTCVDVVLSRLGHTRYEDDACVMAVCVR